MSDETFMGQKATGTGTPIELPKLAAASNLLDCLHEVVRSDNDRLRKENAELNSAYEKLKEQIEALQAVVRGSLAREDKLKGTCMNATAEWLDAKDKIASLELMAESHNAKANKASYILNSILNETWILLRADQDRLLAKVNEACAALEGEKG